MLGSHVVGESHGLAITLCVARACVCGSCAAVRLPPFSPQEKKRRYFWWNWSTYETSWTHPEGLAPPSTPPSQPTTTIIEEEALSVLRWKDYQPDRALRWLRESYALSPFARDRHVFAGALSLPCTYTPALPAC
eukprot:COSAG05_NODE_465_length_9537_cov_21.527086_3_plen_134_part_00